MSDPKEPSEEKCQHTITTEQGRSWPCPYPKEHEVHAPNGYGWEDHDFVPKPTAEEGPDPLADLVVGTIICPGVPDHEHKIYRSELFPEYQGTTAGIQNLVDERNDYRKSLKFLEDHPEESSAWPIAFAKGQATMKIKVDKVLEVLNQNRELTTTVMDEVLKIIAE